MCSEILKDVSSWVLSFWICSSLPAPIAQSFLPLFWSVSANMTPGCPGWSAPGLNHSANIYWATARSQTLSWLLRMQLNNTVPSLELPTVYWCGNSNLFFFLDTFLDPPENQMIALTMNWSKQRKCRRYVLIIINNNKIKDEMELHVTCECLQVGLEDLKKTKFSCCQGSIKN